MVYTKVQTFDSLLIDLKEIEIACLGQEASKPQAKLDPFQAAKLDLSNLLNRMKEGIDFIKEQGEGTGDAIRVKVRLRKDLENATTAKERMDKALEKDEKNFDKEKKKAISEEELKNRREVAILLTRDYSYVKSVIDKVEEQPKYTKARDEQQRRLQERKERRKARKGRGKKEEQDEEEERPLTEEEQLFIQESLKKDQQIDEHLDDIYRGLKRLNVKAQDINVKLTEQGELADKLEDKVDETQQILDSTTKRMNKLMERSGGGKLWCMRISTLAVGAGLLVGIFLFA